MGYSWRSGIPGGGFQNDIGIARSDVHGAAIALSGADVAGFHRCADSSSALCQWVTANRGLTKQDHNNTGAIKWSKSIPGRVYASTGRGNGDLLVSDDGGLSWRVAGNGTIRVSGDASTAGTGNLRRTGRLVEEDGDCVWVGGRVIQSGSGAQGMARYVPSTDTFTVFTGMAGRDIRSIVQDPQVATTLWVGVTDGTSPGLYKLTGAVKTGQPTITKVTGAGGTFATTTLTAVEEACIVVEGAKSWLYFVGGTSYATDAGRMGVWKMNVTDGTAPVEITGTLAKQYQIPAPAGKPPNPIAAVQWHTIDAVRVGSVTWVAVGCWEGERINDDGQKQVNVAISRDSGVSWDKFYAINGVNQLTMPDGRAWWKTAGGDKSYLPRAGSFDSSMVRFDPLNANTCFIAGRAGVWRTQNNGATWVPVMLGLAVSMGHRTVANPANPDQMLNGNVDWGTVRTSQRFNDVVTNFSGSESTYALSWSSRGALVGGGSRSDRSPHSGAAYSIASATASPVSLGWETTNGWGTSAPRPLGICDGTDATGARVILLIAQGAKSGIATEPPAGSAGIWRKVGSGAWSRVSSAAFQTWGVNNSLEADIFWAETVVGAQNPNVYAFDKDTQKLWRSTNYGVTWTTIWTSTETATPAWAWSMAGVDKDTVFVLTPTKLWRFTNASSGSTVTPTQITLPTDCIRPGMCAWDPKNLALVVNQRVGSTPVGIWTAQDVLTTTTPTWVDIADTAYKSSVVYPQNLNIASDGTIMADVWGNAVYLGEPDTGGGDPGGGGGDPGGGSGGWPPNGNPALIVAEDWSRVAAGDVVSSANSAFTGAGPGRGTGNNTVTLNVAGQVASYTLTPALAAVSDLLVVDLLLNLTTLPSINARFIQPRLAGSPQAGVTLTTAGKLWLQDVNANAYISTATITVPTVIRVAARWNNAANTCRLRLWTGSDLTKDVPDEDSGDQTYTNGAGMDDFKLGAIAAMTWQAELGSVLASTVDWPTRIGTVNSGYSGFGATVVGP